MIVTGSPAAIDWTNRITVSGSAGIDAKPRSMHHDVKISVSDSQPRFVFMP